MKIKTAFGLFIFALFLANPPIYGHIVESDNTVGAVMHVDPGDDPVALEPSTIFLEFKDTKGIFNLENCECFLTLTQKNFQILTIPLAPVSGNDKLSAVVPVIFPEKAVYIIKISGKPKEHADFKAFELSYEVAVNKEPTIGNPPQSWISKHTFHLIGGLAILLFLIFALIKQSSNSKV